MNKILKKIVKRVFGSTFKLDSYLTSSNVDVVAERIARELETWEKGFEVKFSLSASYYDRDALRRNSKAIAEKVSSLIGKTVKFQDGFSSGKRFYLYYTISQNLQRDGDRCNCGSGQPHATCDVNSSLCG